MLTLGAPRRRSPSAVVGHGSFRASARSLPVPLYPSPGQRQSLARVFGCTRWSKQLPALARGCHAAGREDHEADVQQRVITLAKLTPERKWLAQAPSVALVQACNDARRAYRNWFDSLSGVAERPQVGHPSSTVTRPPVDPPDPQRFSLHGRRLYVAKVGRIKVRWSRPLPSPPSSVTVICETDGRYYASFVVQREPVPLPRCEHEVGVNVGLDRLAVTSVGRSLLIRGSCAPNNAAWLRPSARCRVSRRARPTGPRHGRGGGTPARSARPAATTRTDSSAADPRQPSGLRRRPGRVRARPHPARQIHPRRQLGQLLCLLAEKRGTRARVLPGWPVRAHVPDLLCVWRQRRPQATEYPGLGVRCLRRGARPRRQRRTEHSRRRAGGEAKRLWRGRQTIARGGSPR